MSAAQAASMIIPGDTVIVSALGATGWATAIFQAIAQRFQKEEEPRNLTVLAPAGQGGRGKVSGSIDDLAMYPGLVSRFFSGHLETFRQAVRPTTKP